jgi:glucan phosphorylase
MEAEVRGCLAANDLDSIVCFNLPSSAFGFKFSESSAKQCLYQDDNVTTLEYLPDEPTTERGKPWLFPKTTEA